MKIREVSSFAAFGLIIAAAILYIGSLGVRVGPPANRTNMSMSVADINNLVVGSNVLLRGVPVGKITKIEASVQSATVYFYVDGRFHIPIDTDVRLDNLSALGESYVALLPRTDKGPVFRDRQHIPMGSVTQPASISELATSVGRVLNQLDPPALQRIISETDAAFPEVNAVLPNLSRASLLLRNTAADMHGAGRELLDNFQALLANAGWVGNVLADVTPHMKTIGKDAQYVWTATVRLRYAGGPQFLADFKTLLDRVQRLLDNNGGDLRVVGQAFNPHVKAIAGALLNFDAGQILSNVLATVPADGTVELHVDVPPGR
jgi:virulence factor Mce-like protein